MPLYDMRCENCGILVEIRCPVAERESQECVQCDAILTPLFTPHTNIYIPRAFGYAFSDLFGTTSEKEFHKEHPELIPYAEAQQMRQRKDIMKSEREQADKTVAEIEHVIKANKTLRSDKSSKRRRKQND